MIKKREIKSENGNILIETYSDTGHYIIKKGSAFKYVSAVDVENSNFEYFESDDYIPIEGVESLEEIQILKDSLDKASIKINRLNLSDNEALSVKDVYPKWESFIDKTIEKGFIVLYGDNLWKARQTHTALGIYPPSINTASLYEVIVKEHTGDIDDPIPYTPPMEIFNGKYYVQNDVVYRCTRDSGIALVHNLSALVGLYVELA